MEEMFYILLNKQFSSVKAVLLLTFMTDFFPVRKKGIILNQISALITRFIIFNIVLFNIVSFVQLQGKHRMLYITYFIVQNSIFRRNKGTSNYA